MSVCDQDDTDRPGVSLDDRRLGLTIYQIADDGLMKANRTDGSGWDWSWADWQRDWMDALPSRFAYRCLPIVIANQTGWWIKNPVGFTARWGGNESPGSIEFQFDIAGDVWGNWIGNVFGAGIITWNTPFLFRTRPAGSRLLVCGPANAFKGNAQPLTAIIESDWISMSFTMNWKIMRPYEPVRFEAGEPLFQAIPMATNICADLEKSAVNYKRLADDPELSRAYHEWDRSRNQFLEMSKAGDLKPDDWQRDYFLGRDASGRPASPVHMTKVKPPKVRYPAIEPSPGVDAPRAAPAYREVSDAWRRWIAENLMLGASRETILRQMSTDGFSPRDSASEIDLASRSPYFHGAERVCNRLKKREWLLAAYRKLGRLHPRSGEIERRHRLPRGEFLEHYYCLNRPVIITGMLDDWPALRRWSLDDFAERFGDREVDVQIGRSASPTYEAEREKHRRKMIFAEFIERVRGSGVTNDLYITANNTAANRTALPELWEEIVQIPEYLDPTAPLDGFFWFGPAGTITPFHHDLTNNLMAQVIGRKRIKLVPSWDMPLMRNFRHVFCEVDGRVIAASPRARFDEPQVLECILNPGEILFLPVGCLHFVEGLDVSVTVSFTNFAFDNNDFSSFYTTYQGV